MNKKYTVQEITRKIHHEKFQDRNILLEIPWLRNTKNSQEYHDQENLWENHYEKFKERNTMKNSMIEKIHCSEIERQNRQTAASDEPTRVCYSKRQWVACCICRQNCQCSHESSNHPLLDKKQVVSWTNERNEMWQRSCENWIPSIATPKEKLEMTSKMAYLKIWNPAGMCLVSRVPEV